MAFRTNKTPDLQEKTASGSVASFNTALAMPLASCKIAVNAWQEGSGDPSPSNVRPIHGFSEVNIVNSGSKNLVDVSTAQDIYIKDSSTLRNGIRLNLIRGDYTFSVSNSTIVEVFISRKINGVWSSNTILVGSPYKVTLECDGYVDVWVSLPYSFNDVISEFMVERGNIKHAYEPYVTPTIYTIQFGEEVYGATVDLGSGVMKLTHYHLVADSNIVVTMFDHGSTRSLFRISYESNNIPYGVPITVISSRFSSNISESGRLYNNDTYIQCIIDNSLITPENVVGFKAWLIDNSVEFVYEMATPIEIQLTPQQIETLIGNNTIFADTGDVDLTYNDLDLAKRGSFREVFKLPS